VTGVWDAERIVIVSCTSCRSVVRIEFEPEDAPNVRARIEPLFDGREEDEEPAGGDTQ
jgi:hypothetical protein